MTEPNAGTAERITCPVCSRPNRALTKTGKIQQHDDPSKGRSWDPFGVRCMASGRRPAEVKQ